MAQDFKIRIRELLQSTQTTTTALAVVCLAGFLAQLVLIWRLWQLFLSWGLRGTGPVYALQLAMFWGGVALWTGGFARIAKLRSACCRPCC
jgi:hypothetical protein